MGYQAADALNNDQYFYARQRACTIQQASQQYAGDPNPANAALAAGVSRGDMVLIDCFVRLAANGPGIADKADLGDGTVDQSKITDADLLSLTQAHWPTVAALYFTPDGSPKP